MSQPFYLILLLLAAVVGMAVAFIAWLRGDRPGARPLTLFVVSASFWAVAEGLSVAAAGINAILVWKQIALSISVAIPLTWLFTVLAYTGNEQWLTRRRIGLLLVEPVVFVGLVWTNEFHHLVWTDLSSIVVGSFNTLVPTFGLGFWGHQVYSYLLVAAGAFLLVRVIFRTDDLYRTQGTALLLAITLPFLGNALYVFELVPRGIDPTAAGYVLSGVVLAVAMFRSQLLRVAPPLRELGRQELLAELDDAVLIIDSNGRIVDMNEASESITGRSRSLSIGLKLDALRPDLADILEETEGKTQIRVDFDRGVRYFDVRISELYREYGSQRGRLVSLRDVTQQRRREQRLNVLNRILRHNLRNELNVVRGNIDIARSESNDDVDGRLDAAVETVDSIIERSNKINRISRLFDTSADGTLNLTLHLKTELGKIKRDYPAAEISIDLPDPLEVAAGPSLTAVFDELVRNAIEHNDDKRADVVVTVDEAASDESIVFITVSDNGPGIRDHELHAIREGRETPLDHGSGIGLWLANWVVERNGGSLDFENTDGGCTVTVEVPRGGTLMEDGFEVTGITELGSQTDREAQESASLHVDQPPDERPVEETED